MGSTSTVSEDEEFMEDLITLSPLTSSDSDCEIVSVSENKTRPDIKKKPHSKEQKKQTTESSYGKGDFYLPARFFDITKNKSLLSKCRALSVSIVDCGKFPEFYRKKCGIRKPRPKSKQIYTLQNLLQDMRFQQKLKQKKLDKLALEYKKENKQVVGQVNLTPSKLPDVDFKKNIGLVGLKIERKLVGLVVDEKSKEDKKRKSKHHKHTADKPKNKSLEGNETRHEKSYDYSIEKNKASKEPAKPSEIMINKDNKLLYEKETSLKCSLNIHPLLSPSVKQKLLEKVNSNLESRQHSVSRSNETVNLISSNIQTYCNKTIIGQKVKQNTANATISDSVPSKIVYVKPTPKVVSDNNALQSSQPVITETNVAAEIEIPKKTVPENHDPKKAIPNEITKPDQVHIKTDPEIKQELKTESLATDKALNEDTALSMTHPNVKETPASLTSNLRNFRPSIEHTITLANPIENLSQFVGQSIPVQTTAVSDPNTVNLQWHRYNEDGLHLNSQHNCLPSDNLTIPETQPNLHNLHVINQKIVSDSTKPKVGDLKIQTVSQINNSVVTPAVSAPVKEVHNVPVVNDMQNNALQFHTNGQVARSTVQGSEWITPGPHSPLLNSGRAKKVVKVKNAHIIKDQNRRVAVGPYTVPPPPYQPYGYQPRMRTSGHVTHWTENNHHANKMPMLMQQLNQRPQPMQAPYYWDPPPSNQEYFYRSGSANPNQAYDELRYHNYWSRHTRPPPLLQPPHPPHPPHPPLLVEPCMKYAPPYQRQMIRPQNNISPNLKPDERRVFTQAPPEKSPINQVSSLPSLSTHSSPLHLPSAQGVNDNHRALSTLVPITSAPPPSLPTLPPQTVIPTVPQTGQEMHTAEILYPNTTFSQESSTSHVIYTEASNHINEATHENQQEVDRCLREVTTIEMTQTLSKLPKDEKVTSSLDMPLLDSIESDVRKPNDTVSNVLSSQSKAHETPMKSNPTTKLNKPIDTTNNVPSSQQQDSTRKKSKPTTTPTPNNTSSNIPSSQQQANDNTPTKSKPTAGEDKPNSASNNMQSAQQLQAKNSTPVKSKPRDITPKKTEPTASESKQKDTVLLSQHQVKNITPMKPIPTVAPKLFYGANNVPKKRLYIPSDTETSPIELTATGTEKSEPAVLERNVNKGYSPPILPIPTVQKSLEILALANAIKTPNYEQNISNNAGPLTPVKQIRYRISVDGNTQAITPKKITAPCCIVENPAKKQKPNHTPQSATRARKISIDEYKKRHDSKSIDLMDESKDHKNKDLTPTKDTSHKKRYNNNNENRGVDLQDLGYDSDPASKF